MLGPSLKEEGLFWVSAEGFPGYVTTKYYLSGTSGLSTTPPTGTTSQSRTFKFCIPLSRVTFKGVAALLSSEYAAGGGVGAPRSQLELL